MALTRRYNYCGLVLEVTARDERQLDAHDSYGNGSRLSFNGGAVVVDLLFRAIAEEPGTALSYYVYESGHMLFSATGPANNRKYIGGRKGIGSNSLVYSF